MIHAHSNPERMPYHRRRCESMAEKSLLGLERVRSIGRTQHWYHDRKSYEHTSFPTAVFSNVINHRLEGLCMNITIVFVNKVYGLIATQIVICLLQCKSEPLTELTREDKHPFQFIFDVEQQSELNNL